MPKNKPIPYQNPIMMQSTSSNRHAKPKGSYVNPERVSWYGNNKFTPYLLTKTPENHENL